MKHLSRTFVTILCLFAFITLTLTTVTAAPKIGSGKTTSSAATTANGSIGNNTNGKCLFYYPSINPEVNNLGGYDLFVQTDPLVTDVREEYVYFCKTINGKQTVFAIYNFTKQYWYYRAGYDGKPAINGEKFNNSAVDPKKLYCSYDPRIDHNRTKPSDGVDFVEISEVLDYVDQVQNYMGFGVSVEPQTLCFDTNAKPAGNKNAVVKVGKYTATFSESSPYYVVFQKNGTFAAQYNLWLQKWDFVSPEFLLSDKELAPLFSEVDPSINLSRLIERPSDYSGMNKEINCIWKPLIADSDDSEGVNRTNVGGKTQTLKDGTTLKNFNVASGKPKVLVFFSESFSTDISGKLLGSIRDSFSSFEGMDLLFLGDDNGWQNEEFKTKYASPSMNIYFGNFTNIKNNYLNLFYNCYPFIKDYPLVIYIDKDNKVQYTEYGRLTAADVLDSIERFLPGAGDSNGFGVWYDTTAVADTSLRSLGKYSLKWNKVYVTFSERENGRDVIKACYNHCFQYWEYQAGKKGYTAGNSNFDASSIDLSKLYKRIDSSIKLSRFTPKQNELKPLVSKKTYSGKQCSIGDIVLQDGTTVKPDSYRADSKNPAVGVVAFFRDENYPNSKDAGTQLGNVEDAVILGTKKDKKTMFASKVHDIFDASSHFENIHIPEIMYALETKNDTREKNSYTPESDVDGSDNYRIIREAIDTASKTNYELKAFNITYPAFEAAEKYGTTNNIKGMFSSGWYLPTFAEYDYIARNYEAINYGLEKVKGADSMLGVFDASLRSYLWDSQLSSTSPNSNYFSTYVENNVLGYGTNRQYLGDEYTVRFLRDYIAKDASYTSLPVNLLASGTYGEKPVPNAVGDIVFTDGSATALREELILTKEQRNAVMAFGAYIGDGYIGEKDYLYVASVDNLNILDCTVVSTKGQQQVAPVSQGGSHIALIPLDYDSLAESGSTSGEKNWETIKKSIPWATGEKDRKGVIINGFTMFIYADLYGSGKSFSYRATNSDGTAGKDTTVYTPSLSGEYSSGWFIPADAENDVAEWSLVKFNKLFKKITNAETSGSVTATRHIGIYTPYDCIEDNLYGEGYIRVFHKAAKVHEDDLHYTPVEFGPYRCYLGDIVLEDGSLVRESEYEYNPKNPPVGVVAFFKDKAIEEGNVGDKENAVIMGLKGSTGTWYEAIDFAEVYGSANNIKGIYRTEWRIPSFYESVNFTEFTDIIISENLARLGISSINVHDVWNTTEKNGGIYGGTLVRGGEIILGKNETHHMYVLHDYVEPKALVAADRGLTTDRNHPYAVGDIVLSDGSIVSSAQYKANSRNPAVGIIAFFKDSSFPNSGDYGSRTGTKENAYIIGLKQERGGIAWAASGSQGLSIINDIQTLPVQTGYGAASVTKFHEGSDNDGSDNWNVICANVTDEGKAGRYPTFEYAASYGKNAGITGTYSGGWYVPSLAELCYVYRNKNVINESIALIDGAMNITGALYRSSSIASTSLIETYSVNGAKGTIEYERKRSDFDGHGVLVIRPLSTAQKTPEPWTEPVIEKKTATNPVLKKSTGARIGEKAAPSAIGDIIFSDGSATAYSQNLSLTDRQKKEAVAVAAFIGDGNIGKKGKIYGLSVLGKECAFARFSGDYIRLENTWNNNYFVRYFDALSSLGCYPNGDKDAYQVSLNDITYFTGDLDGSDNWKQLFKADPAGEYPAWEFAWSLGDGWYIGSMAELWKALQNKHVISVARSKVDAPLLVEMFSSSYSDATDGIFYWVSKESMLGDWSLSGNNALSQYEGTSYVYPFYAFDMDPGAVASSSTVLGADGFVLVEGGTFKMGNASGENDEKPVHGVTLSSFYMCDHEVTQAEYKVVMGSNPSAFSGDNKPVEQVSWFDAIEYCNALSRKEGLTPCYTKSGDSYTCNWNANGYRLPTEAEWEYAARGGKKSKGYTYSGGNSAGNVAWSKNNASSTQNVKSKAANELGLYDMSGNVSEWVWDWYGSYSSASSTDPKGASSGTYRARRGGSWSESAAASGTTYRDGNSPSRTANNRGFRVVLPFVAGSQISSASQAVKTTQAMPSDFVRVQGGTFYMGSSVYPDAKPVHKVTVSSFYMCDHEVTQDEYYALMEDFSSPVIWDGNKPVDGIRWETVVEYCNKRSLAEGLTPCYKVDGSSDTSTWGTAPGSGWVNGWGITCDWDADGYRLPTEAEWEYAARGGQKSKGYEYSGSNDINSVAWYEGNMGNEGCHAVKTKQPNELGLYDMSGNVAEFCWEWHKEYSGESAVNPRATDNVGGMRVLRGGSYVLNSCRVEFRGSDVSGGFRLVRTAANNTPVSTVPVREPVLNAIKSDDKGNILVEGGIFRMGNEYGDSSVKPVHNVTLSSFYLSDHEVTQAEYMAIMGTNPSKLIGDDKPVEQVSWSDAIDYCNRRSVKEGLTPCYSYNGITDVDAWHIGYSFDYNDVVCNWDADGYRLPTEAEWEYAARGGKYQYSVGKYTWNKTNSYNTTHEVKTSDPNLLGIYDMYGNVWEWVWDLYGKYTGEDQVNPRGDDRGSYRVRRGGSYKDSSYGDRQYDSYGKKYDKLGFRVARSAK